MLRSLTMAALGGCAALFCAPLARAQTPVAAEIMQRAYERHALGFDESKTVVTMTLKNKKGEKKVRRIVSRATKAGGTRRQHVCFLAPDELKNTAFVSAQQQDGRDDQYLWLPNQGRLRRISASQRSGSFMGTDFSYRDLEERRAGDGVHLLLREEKVGKHDTWVIETTAKPGIDEEYGKIVTWVMKRNHFPLRTKFFDKSGAHVKTLFVREIGKLGARRYAKRVRMANLATKRSTYLDVLELDTTSPIPEEMFTAAYVGRGQECAP